MDSDRMEAARQKRLRRNRRNLRNDALSKLGQRHSRAMRSLSPTRVTWDGLARAWGELAMEGVSHEKQRAAIMEKYPKL